MLPPNGTIDPSSYWTPFNYKSCFEKDDVCDLDQLGNSPYEIMNSTGPSAIFFKRVAESGIFLFHVQIVDPYYRFLNYFLFKGLCKPSKL